MAKTQTNAADQGTVPSKPPPLWREDGRPDPSLLTPQQRLSEFGDLMFRAIERRRSRKSQSRHVQRRYLCGVKLHRMMLVPSRFGPAMEKQLDGFDH